jgi:hypothetical protein
MPAPDDCLRPREQLLSENRGFSRSWAKSKTQPLLERPSQARDLLRSDRLVPWVSELDPLIRSDQIRGMIPPFSLLTPESARLRPHPNEGRDMLNIIQYSEFRLCDQIPRRNALRIGAAGFGFGAFGLADLLRAEAGSGKKRYKTLIDIFLGGGPPHQDMWDLKMDAPAEIRGEFSPIETSVPGIQIGETFPKIAGLMQKCVLVRSVVGSVGAHDADQCMTGWSAGDLAFIGGRPSIGAVAGKVLGPVHLSVPPFVGLTTKTAHVPWSDAGAPRFPWFITVGVQAGWAGNGRHDSVCIDRQ